MRECDGNCPELIKDKAEFKIKMPEIRSTKITLKDAYGEYNIEVPRTDLSIDEVFDDLVRPVLLAAGYSKEIIDEIIGG